MYRPAKNSFRGTKGRSAATAPRLGTLSPLDVAVTEHPLASTTTSPGTAHAWPTPVRAHAREVVKIHYHEIRKKQIRFLSSFTQTLSRSPVSWQNAKRAGNRAPARLPKFLVDADQTIL